MNIVILGPQASGKGTQAEIIANILGLFHFEMGKFLRDLAKSNPRIDEIVNKQGKLLPDDMFFFAMKEFLGEKITEGKGVILDGFPRTVEQYQMLKNWFDQESLTLDKVIFLDISKGEIIRRLSSRRTCSQCGSVYNLETSPKPKSDNKCDKCQGALFQREDDEPDAIKRRLSEYEDKTLPLLAVIDKEGILIRIDGEKSIGEVTDNILKKITEK